MPRTQERSEGIGNYSIYKEDINISTSGKALITHIVEIANSGVKIGSYSGADSGTGAVGLSIDTTLFAKLDPGTINGQIPYWDNTISKYIPSGSGKLSYSETGGVATLTFGSATIDSTVFPIIVDGTTINAQFYGTSSLRSAFAKQSNGGVVNLARPDLFGINTTSGNQLVLGRANYISDVILGDGTNVSNAYIRFPNYGAGILKTDVNGVISLDTSTYLTSQTSHADVVVDGDFTSQGIMLRGASSGVYSILTDASVNWNTAYDWGNHASAGYGLASALTTHGNLTTTAHGLGASAFHADSYFQQALTNPVTGTGTSGYLTQFTGTGTIGNSGIYRLGDNYGIGTTAPEQKLTLSGTIQPGLGITSDNADAGVRTWELAINNFAYGDFAIWQSATKGGDPLAGTAKFVINNQGSVGIGTVDTAGYKLYNNGTLYNAGAATFASSINGLYLGADATYGAPFNTFSFGSAKNNGVNRIYGTSDASDGLYLASATGRGIYLRVNGTATNALALASDGAATFASSVTATNFILSSDRRDKTHINSIHFTPNNIEYKSFELLTELGQLRYGVIAQDLQFRHPELVRVASDGKLKVAYIDLLIMEVASLKERVKQLENRN